MGFVLLILININFIIIVLRQLSRAFTVKLEKKIEKIANKFPFIKRLLGYDKMEKAREHFGILSKHVLIYRELRLTDRIQRGEFYDPLVA